VQSQSITPAGPVMYPSKLMAMKQTSGASIVIVSSRDGKGNGGLMRCQGSIVFFLRGRSRCIRRLRKVSAQVSTFCWCVVRKAADLSHSQKRYRVLPANIGELVRVRRSLFLTTAPATRRVGLAGAMSQAMWLGVVMLSNSDQLDGILGRLSLLILRASESICFRALS
jgi:hypothetical protein